MRPTCPMPSQADGSRTLDLVPMVPSEEANDISLLIDNDGEKASYITIKHIDVERFELSHGGELASEAHGIAGLAPQSNLSIQHDGACRAAKSSEPALG